MHPLPPGSRIGIIGGGQLGRMLALEARRLGYVTRVLDPDPRSPAAQVADEHQRGGLADPQAAAALAGAVDVVTYEFENVALEALTAAEAAGMVHPSGAVLRAAQHRLREKEAALALGIPVPPFGSVGTLAELPAALARSGLPAVVKTATSGYDGKGQAVVRTEAEATSACARLLGQADTLIVESLVDFQLELSVVCARSTEGLTVCYAPGENRHSHGILDITLAPARVSPETSAAAQALAARLAAGLGVVGLLAVEMFLTRDGSLLFNEMAPRPHNSGHHTLDACATSQFEQLLRAVCGLPLGSTGLHAPVAMANLLGDLWPAGGQPDFPRALQVPGVRLHLYGKAEARPGRKMGHLTALAATVEAAEALVLAARQRLVR